jgi:hypothetical protein
VREVRALLDLMLENEAAVQNVAAACVQVLLHSIEHLTILHLEVGEEELMQGVAAALAKLQLLGKSNLDIN